MTMHPNSLAAFHNGRREFGRRANEVLGVLVQLGTATDRQICRHLNYFDMNTVRPRITELLRAGVIEEIATTKDSVTEKTVRIVRIKPPAPTVAMQLQMEAIA